MGDFLSAPRRKNLLQVLLLCALIFVQYFPSLKAGYIWDDDAYVTHNANLQTVQGFKRIWLEPRTSPQYYPLVFSSFWIERQLFGPGPFAGHLVNICLHMLNALLLWIVLHRLGVAAAFFIALVFGLHPVHLESVAWITERKNVLSAFFYLAAMLAYLSFALPPRKSAPGTSRRPIVPYLACLLLFVAALLSKSVTATLPVALLLILWWKKESVTRRDWLALGPLFIIGIAFGLSTAWLEMHHVGAAGEEWGLSLIDRVLVAGRAAWFYAGKLVWPHPLSFIYPRWHVDSGDLLQFLFPLSLLACCLALWFFRKRTGRGPLVAVLFFLCTLFPALGFLNVYPMRYSYVADHFQYLASIGIIALVILLLRSAWSKLKRSGLRRASMALLVLPLILVGRREIGKYNDLETLWKDTLAKNGDCWMAYNNLGNLRIAQGEFSQARACFVEALKRNPRLAVAWNNLGMAWMRAGEMKNAEENFLKAIEMDSRYAEAHNNLGVVLGRERRSAEAILAYRRALEIDPRYAMAHYNLANILSRLNDPNDAQAHYREAIRLRPDFALAHFYFAVSLMRQGRNQDAQPYLALAFQMKPDFWLGHFLLGNIHLEQGNVAEAIAEFTQAIAINPGHAEARRNLGAALLRNKQWQLAAERLAESLRLQPNDAAAENGLGVALESMGRVDEAISHYDRALKLAPGFRSAAENLVRARKSKQAPPSR